MQRTLALVFLIALVLLIALSPAYAEPAQQCSMMTPIEAGPVDDILKLIIKVYLTILQAVVKFVCGGLNAFGFSC